MICTHCGREVNRPMQHRTGPGGATGWSCGIRPSQRQPFVVHHESAGTPAPGTTIQAALRDIIHADAAKRAELPELPHGYYWAGELVFEGLEVHIRYTPTRMQP